MLNYLGPIYATGAGSNDGDYSNKEFDKLISDASAAEGDARYKLISDAQAILLEELPAIPLWYQNATAVTKQGPQRVRVQLEAEARLLQAHQVVVRSD